MGAHYGLIAVTGSVDQLHAAFTQVWPEYEIVTQEQLATIDDAWAWQEQHGRFVSSRDWTPDNPEISAYFLRQDGPWAVLLDSKLIISCDEKALSKLSTMFGACLSFVIETTSGCAFFYAYENGELRRQLMQTDTGYESKGNPLSEETGLTENGFYQEEFDALIHGFGLRPLTESLANGYLAIAAADKTDYTKSLVSHAMANMPPATGGHQKQKKPWWKIW